MLGLKIGTLLVITIFSFLIIAEANAESFSIQFDKSEYFTNDSISITGKIYEIKMPVIAMRIYDTDGNILSANNLAIESDGSFTKTFILNSPFYEKSGEYKVKFDYGKISQNNYFIIDNQDKTKFSNESVDALDSSNESLKPEILSLKTEKSRYTNNDIIVISGSVSTLDPPTVLIGIYDTFGTLSGFYFAPVTPDLKFSTNFPAKSGVNFKINGTYSIKAHFAESSSTTSFEFYEVFDESIPIKDKTEIEKNKKNDSSETNKSQNKKDPNELKSIISNVKKQTSIKSTNDDLIKKEVKSLNLDKIKPKNKNNLTVSDIELGLMLNQINLTCDSSKYTDTITYYDGMGPALYRLCKFDNSLKFFDESLIKDPDNVEILSNKGSTLGKLGYYSEAIVYYDYALGIDPQFLPAINNKANSLVNMGKYNEAKLLYEYAIEINPNYETARKNLLLLNSEIFHKKEILEKKQSSPITIDDKIELEKSKKIKNLNSISPKENQTSFFEEVRIAFSSLFRLLN